MTVSCVYIPPGVVVPVVYSLTVCDDCVLCVHTPGVVVPVVYSVTVCDDCVLCVHTPWGSCSCSLQSNSL